jgi:DNA polymerase III alpha subunit (gram-positive type)
MLSSDKYIIYVIDTETTGLDAKENDVIEVSMCRFIFGQKEREQKTWLIKAQHPETIDDVALRINKHKREDILCLTKYGKDNYKDPAAIVVEIEQWMADDDVSAVDRIFAGHNPVFDLDMLKELWSRADSSDTFPFMTRANDRVLDTKQLAAMIDVCTGRRRRFYNLSTLVKSFSVKKARAHTAAGDVQMTTDLLVKMLEPLMETVSEAFKDCYEVVDS